MPISCDFSENHFSYRANHYFYHIDLDEKVVREISSNMECTGDEIVKHINQKTDEILFTIKTQLANAKPTTAQMSDTLGKLCPLLLHTIMIINKFLCELFRRFRGQKLSC